MAETTDAAVAPGRQDERVLVVTRLLDAPRALVFKAWTQPEHLARWWGPQGFSLPSCELDPRPGGTYRFVMRSPEGSEHRVAGTYREVVEPERLVFTWSWLDEDDRPKHETLVTVTFAEEGAQTRMTLHQAVFESVTARDSHRGGWTGSFDRLAEFVMTL